MPTIAALGNVLIRMFADDHNPPHFHVVTPDHEALIRLSDLSVMAGSIDPPQPRRRGHLGGAEPGDAGA